VAGARLTAIDWVLIALIVAILLLVGFIVGRWWW
jgi:hypothetical protein